MNIPVRPPADIRVISDDTRLDSDTYNPPKRLWSQRKKLARESATARLERDRARGYAINVKQVVLAFAVEFVIIGLIIISQILYAADNANTSEYKIMAALLFPIAMAVVELARVPLAIAVRTQNSWNIQLAAILGVSCAVVVTSASLSQIGHYTFNPRLENVHIKRTDLDRAHEARQAYVDQRGAAQAILDQRIKEWNVLSERYKTLSSQLNAQPNQTCTPTTKRNPDGTDSTVQTCRVNPALKTLQTELADTKSKLTELEAAGRQAQSALTKFDVRPFDEAISKSEAEYRDSIYQSQLHSYTAMLFRKDPREVSDGEVKTLEWYLIVIPSIAAALSSTLIAMTAVRRIRSKPEAVAAIPDEAAAYLFGPLVAAIKEEAKDAVAAAMSYKLTPPPNSSQAKVA